MTGDEKTVLAKEQHLTGDAKTVLADEQHPTGDAKTGLADEQHPTGDAKTVLADEKHLAGDVKTVLADEQHLTGDVKTVLADEQHVSRHAKTVKDSDETQLEDQDLLSAQELKSLPHLIVNTETGQDQDGFTVKQELGRGGMGEVHLARQHVLNRDVALKRPLGSGAAELLMKEARLTGALEHPGIVPIHALGLDGAGQPVMVMKHVEGVTWAGLIKDPHHPGWRRNQGDRLAWQLRIMSQVCDAVHYAHCRGVIHRDIKLDNIMIGSYGEVYLLDWGIAKRIQQAQGTRPTGTLSYMAPEMVEGKDHGERTDVYLLGATLHHVLVGQPRHNEENIVETLASASASAPYSYPPTVPAGLAMICNRATAADPEARYQTAEELRRALDAFGEHQAAMELIEECYKRLEELKRAVETQSPDELNIRKLFHESQFALEQAMKSLPQDRRAKELSRELLLVMARYEIRAGHLDMAKALAIKISPPYPELQLELAGLEQRLLEQQQEQGRLQALERDISVEISVTHRSKIHVAMAVGSLLIGALGVGLHLMNVQIWTPLGLLVMMLALLVLMSAGFALGRSEFFSTRLNRGISLTLLAWAASLCVNRALGMANDVPVPVILATDMMMSAMAAIVCGLTVRQPYLWCGLAFLLGTLVSATALVPPPVAWVGSLVVAFILAAASEYRLGAEIDDEESSEISAPSKEK